MASYDPPSGYISGAYNPTYYNNSSSNSSGSLGISTDESNTFTVIQYCTATMPDSSGSSTVMPTTAWVQSAISLGISEISDLSVDNIVANNVTIEENLSAGTGGTVIFGTGGTFPSSSSSSAGTGLFWNHNSGQGESDILNYAQGGTGGFNFYKVNDLNAPEELLSIDGSGNLNVTGDITSPTITSINTTLSTVPTVSSSNTFNQLQYCTASMPSSSDSSTAIPTTAWVQSAIPQIPTNSYSPIILTNTTSNTNTWTFTISSFLGYVFDWYLTPITTSGSNIYPMSGYLQSNEDDSYPYFQTSNVGYSYGEDGSSTTNMYLFSIQGIGIAGLVDSGNPAYAWTTTNTFGTNSLTSITPNAKTNLQLGLVAYYAYTYQVTFTLTTQILYGVKLTIFPKVL